MSADGRATLRQPFTSRPGFRLSEGNTESTVSLPVPSVPSVFLFFSPNSLLWGSLLEKKGWPRYALAASPELVRHVSAIVRLVSALIPLWPRLQTLSALCPPLVSASCVSMCPPCVCSLSAMCLLFASSGPPCGLCPLVAVLFLFFFG